MNRWNAPRRVLPVSRVLLVMIARVLRQFPSPEGHATDRHYPSCRHQGSLPIVELLSGVAPVIAQQCALMVLSPTWLEYVTRQIGRASCRERVERRGGAGRGEES